MAEIIGYAEDALTYKVFKENLDDFLNQMNVPKESRARQIKNAVVFYRPSFGRKQLGEVDSIVATDTKIFLVECKWYDSGELSKLSKKNAPVDVSELLRLEQIHRNEIITAMINEVVDKIQKAGNADELNKIISETIETNKGKIKKMSGSVTYQNMEFIITRLIKTLDFKRLRKKGGRYDVVRNVILFLTPESKRKEKLGYRLNRLKPLKSINGNMFNILAMYYNGLDNYRFVGL